MKTKELVTFNLNMQRNINSCFRIFLSLSEETFHKRNIFRFFYFFPKMELKSMSVIDLARYFQEPT